MKKLIKKKSVFLSWLMTYVVFIVLFAAIMVSVLSFTKVRLEQEILKTNEAVFQMMRENGTSFKNGLDILVQQFSIKQTLYNVLKSSQRRDNIYYYTLRKTYDDLASMIVPDAAISRFVIYDKPSACLIENGGITRAEEYYQEFCRGTEDYVAWKAAMDQRRVQELYKTRDDEIVYIHSIIGGAAEENVGAILFVINRQQLLQKLHIADDGTAVAILKNEKGEVILAVGVDAVRAERLENHSQEGVWRETIAGQRTVLFGSPVERKLQCIYGVTSRAMFQTVTRMLVGLGVLLPLFMALSLYMAYWLTRRNYLPIAQMTGMVADVYQKHADDAEYSNEMDLLQGVIGWLLANNTRYETQKYRYNSLAFKQEFIRYLQGSVYYKSPKQLFSKFSIPFSHRWYAVVLIFINELDDAIWQNETAESELVEVAIQNVYSEYFEPDVEEITLSMGNGRFFCLLGSDLEDSAQVRERIAEVFGKAIAFEKKQFGIEYSVFAGGCFQELLLLKEQYRLTLNAYLFTGDPERDVSFYQEGRKENASLQEIPELINHAAALIKNAEFDSARNLLKHFFETVWVGDPAWLVQVKYQLLAMFMEIAQSAAADDADLFALLDRLAASDTKWQMQKITAEILDMILAQCAKQPQMQECGTLTDKIIQYVDEHYSDLNLNVNYLGEVFGRTPRYLSRVFHQSRGELLRDYIMRVRLKNAERLLYSDKKLDDVARACGFSNTSTFIRAFKQFFGVTPGQKRL